MNHSAITFPKSPSIQYRASCSSPTFSSPLFAGQTAWYIRAQEAFLQKAFPEHSPETITQGATFGRATAKKFLWSQAKASVYGLLVGTVAGILPSLFRRSLTPMKAGALFGFNIGGIINFFKTAPKITSEMNDFWAQHPTNTRKADATEPQQPSA